MKRKRTDKQRLEAVMRWAKKARDRWASPAIWDCYLVSRRMIDAAMDREAKERSKECGL